MLKHCKSTNTWKGQVCDWLLDGWDAPLKKSLMITNDILSIHAHYGI
jgi:hypothetical protein